MIQPAPKNESGHPILIVDDEEIVLVALRDTLLREGYKVVSSPHAVHALSIVKEQKFSVVISDHQMPMITGLDFLAQVKQVQPDATRILITAVLSLGTVIDAINKGEIYRFVVKPWLREELLATVRNAVQRHELICQNNRLHEETEAINRKLIELNYELEAQLAGWDAQNKQLLQITEAQEKNLNQSIQLCLHALQAFHPPLAKKGRMVATLCNAMAKELDLPQTDRQTLEISALIHDIGMVDIPRELIRKLEDSSAKWSEPELQILRQHPVIGGELARFSDPLQNIAPLIRAHHERMDGSGYPDGLKGEFIPFLARLLMVAVAFVESPLQGFAARDAVAVGSGSLFDPEAIRVFLKVFPTLTLPVNPRKVSILELRPGMVVAESIYGPTGNLLIADGQALTAAYIARLMMQQPVQSIPQTLMVYC